MSELTQSVGRGGKNQTSETRLVQTLLNEWRSLVGELPLLKVDGVAGEKTFSAIELFQKKVVGLSNPDGRIDAGGATFKKLVAIRSPLLPLGKGSGFYSYSPDARQFGTEKTIASLKKLCLSVKQSLKIDLGIGDLSFSTRALMPPHSSHRKGTDVDIRPIRKDRRALPVTISSPDYDRELTKKVIETARRDGNLQFVLFNDLKIFGVVRQQNHDNHLHLRYFQ